jgi:hypothetical protein
MNDKIAKTFNSFALKARLENVLKIGGKNEKKYRDGMPSHMWIINVTL